MAIREDLLGYQRRSMAIGQIRMGTSEPIPGKNGRKPVRLDTWRFTSPSEQAIIAAAELFGGQVTRWAERPGQFQVITDQTSINVYVPPRGTAVDTSMELWDGNRRLRKCDGARMEFPAGKQCMCPLPADPSDPGLVMQARLERERLAAMRPPQACKILTRFSLQVPNLPGMFGIWRLNTGSVNCAVESADSGDALEMARAANYYLPAVLLMTRRFRSDTGTPYPVPVLMLRKSLQEVAARALPAGTSGLVAQLRSADPDTQPKALTAAPAEDMHRPGGPATPPDGTCGQASTPGTNGARPVHPQQAELAEDERRYQVAQSIADECARNGISAARFTELWARARSEELEDEEVYTTDDHFSGPCLPLGVRLRELWLLKRAGAA